MRGIYTIKLKENKRSVDIDLPQTANIDTVITLLTDLLIKTKLITSKKNSYSLYSNDLKRKLEKDETLSNLCLWEGSILILE